MHLKQIYSNNLNSLENLLDKKILIKNLYGKFLIRSTVLSNLNLHVIDNHSSFFNIPSIELQKFNKFNSSNLVGNTLIAKEFEYKNKLNRSINIKTFLINNKSIKSNYTLKSFYNLLNITSKDSYQSSLFLLNPKKGGFDCYSTGVLGFMPRRHALFAFLKTFSQLSSVKKKNSAISNFNFLLKKDNFIKNKFLIRLSNWWGKITLSPKFKKSKFSRFSKRRKKRIFLNKTNFVFLTKKSSYLTKNIKKINENKKY